MDGIMPRAFQYVFQAMEERRHASAPPVKVRASTYEVYNEQVRACKWPRGSDVQMRAPML